MRIPGVGGGQRNAFGNRGPDRLGPTQFDTRGMTAAQEGLADGAQRLAQAAGMVAARQQQVDEEGHALARAKATNAAMDYDERLSATMRELEARRLDGSLKTGDYENEARAALDDIVPPEMRELDPVGREQYTGMLKRSRMRADDSIRTLVGTAKREEWKGQLGLLRDNYGKSASDPNANPAIALAHFDSLEDEYQLAGMGGQFAKDRQEFMDGWFNNNARARFAAGRDDDAALGQLEHDLTADDGYYTGKLDANQRTLLLQQVLGRRDALSRRAQEAAGKAEAVAERALTQFESQIATGVMAPIDTMGVWQQAVGGGTPEQRERFDALLQGEAELRQVRKLAPEHQRAYLNELEVRQQADGATVTQVGNLRRLQSVIEADMKRLRESPLEHDAILNGRTVAPLDMQGLLSGDVSGLQQQFAERLVALTRIRRQFGPAAGNAPLLPQEASALASALSQSGTRGTSQLFGALSKVIPEPEAYRAAMQQIAPDSPVRALAGTLYARQRVGGSPDGAITAASVQGAYGDVAMYLLKGEALLNPSKEADRANGKSAAIPMPPPERMAKAIEQQIGKAFAGRARDYETAVQAVRAYYAAKSADEGDMKSELNPPRLQQAVRAVIGERARYEGQDVIPPWGMSADEFEDKAETFVQARLRAAQIEDPGDVALMNVRGRDGVFLLTRGMEPLVDRNGQPLIIRMGARR